MEKPENLKGAKSFPSVNFMTPSRCPSKTLVQYFNVAFTLFILVISHSSPGALRLVNKFSSRVFPRRRRLIARDYNK